MIPNTHVSSCLDAYLEDIHADLNCLDRPNLVRARETLESLQKTLELSSEISFEKINQASEIFAEFLSTHQIDRALPLQLTKLEDVKRLYDRFKEFHHQEPDLYFSHFINHLLHHRNHPVCRKNCIEYLIFLGLLEEIRQEDNLSQCNCTLIIHYYTKAFSLAQESPDYLPVLRELCSNLLLRILRDSFHHYAANLLGKELAQEMPHLKGFIRYVTALDQLRKQQMAFPAHLRELYDLCRNLLTRSKIPEKLKSEVSSLLNHIQMSIVDLKKETLPTSSFIERNQEALQAYRAEFQREFDSLYTEKIPNAQTVRRFQKDRFAQFKRFFENSLLKGPLFAFEPTELPPYEIRVAGSVGREELCPYSDLECFILLKERHPALIRALNILQLEVLSFGETLADIPGISAPFFQKGFFLDPLDPSEGCPLLISTPEELACRQIERNSDQTYSQESYSLLRSSSLFCNESNLFQMYSENLYKVFNPITESSFLKRFNRKDENSLPLHQRRAERSIKSLLKDYHAEIKKSVDSFVVLDIKERFLAPLAYLIHNLGIYFAIQETNSLDIVDRLHERGFFDVGSAELIKDAIAALYMIRVRLHLKYHRACDDALFRPTHSVESISIEPLLENEKACLRYTDSLVLKSLFHAMKEGSIPQAIHLLADVSLESIHYHSRDSIRGLKNDAWCTFFREYIRYLVIRGKEEEIETLYRYLSTDSCYEPLRYEIYSLSKKIQKDFSLIPNAETGFRYAYLEHYRELQRRLMEMTLSTEEMDRLPKDQVRAKISVAQWEGELIPLTGCGKTSTAEVITRYIHPSLIDKLLDSDAKEQALANRVGDGCSTLWIKRQYPKSLHRVVALSMKENEPGIHIKERPTHNPMEFAIVSLLNRLFGRGTTPSVLAKLTVEIPGGRSYTTAVSLSLTQKGEPLSQLIKQKAFLTNSQLDSEQYTEQLISHVLILPTDAHGGNLLVTDQTPRQILSLDLEASFIPLRLGNTKKIDFVSELFCHPVITELSEQVMRRFLEIKTDPLLLAWLNELLDVLDGWSGLLPDEKEWLLKPIVDTKDLSPIRRDQRCVVQCLIPPGTVARLYQQINHLKQEFEKSLRTQQPLKPLQLLEQIISCWEERTQQIGKVIAEHYQNSYKTLLWFERAPHERLAAATGAPIQSSRASSFTLCSLIGHLPTQSDLERQAYHPSEALKELKFMSSLYQVGVQFHSKGRNVEVKIKEDPQLSFESQRALIRLLTLNSRITHLSLTGLSALDDHLLEDLIRKHGANLKTLNLRGCQRITLVPLLRNVKQLFNLEEIILSGDQLGNFCLVNGGSVHFPKLKKLIWIDGPINRARLALNAPLEHLHLVQNFTVHLENHSLKTLRWINGDVTQEEFEQIMFRNPNLQTVNIKGCTQINSLPAHASLLNLSVGQTGIGTIAAEYPKLLTLRVAYCPQLTSIKLESPLLGNLKANNCFKLKKVEIASIILQKLNLEGCPKITLKSEGWLPSTLESLNLSGNEGVTPQLVQEALEKLLGLRKFVLDGCPQLEGNLTFRIPSSNLKRLSLRKNFSIKQLDVTAPGCIELALDQRLSLPLTSSKVIIIEPTDLETSRDVLEKALTITESSLKVVSLKIDEQDDLEILSNLWSTLTHTYFKLSCELRLDRFLLLLKLLPPNVFEFKANISNKNMNDEEGQILAEALPRSHVTHLVLPTRRMSLPGLKALCDSLPNTDITSLDMTDGDGAIIPFLARSLSLSPITHLELIGTNIDTTGAQALALALPKSRIHYLGLSSSLDDKDMQLIITALPQSRVVHLDLCETDIRGDGADLFVRILPQSCITHINLACNDFWDDGLGFEEFELQTLASALPQSNIIHLCLANNHITVEGIRLLAPVLPRSCLNYLDLSCNAIRQEGSEVLAPALPQSNLNYLNLHGNYICNEGSQILAQVLPQSTLTYLDLSENNIDQEGARSLAQALPQTNITTFIMGRNTISEEGAKSFAQVLPRSKITYLDLSFNNIGDGGTQALTQVLPQTGITHLDLHNNNLEEIGIQFLAQVLPKTRITHLNLENNDLSGQGVLVLIQNVFQSCMLKLTFEFENRQYYYDKQSPFIYLAYCKLGDKVRPILSQDFPQFVTDLNLKGNCICNEDLPALAKCLSQSNVNRLSLKKNNIDSRGAQILTSGLALSRITCLNLGFNEIAAEGMKALAQGLSLMRLTTLILSSNKIYREGALALASGLPQSSVTYLDIRSNDISEVGTEAIASILPQCKITHLNLGNNFIGVKGATALSQTLPNSCVTHLLLDCNYLGDEGAEALASGLSGSKIIHLNLKKNRIHDHGAEKLIQELRETEIKELNLKRNKIVKKCEKACIQALPTTTIQFEYFNQISETLTQIDLDNCVKLNTLSEEETIKKVCEEVYIQALQKITIQYDYFSQIFESLTQRDWEDCAREDILSKEETIKKECEKACIQALPTTTIQFDYINQIFETLMQRDWESCARLDTLREEESNYYAQLTASSTEE